VFSVVNISWFRLCRIRLLPEYGGRAVPNRWEINTRLWFDLEIFYSDIETGNIGNRAIIEGVLQHIDSRIFRCNRGYRGAIGCGQARSHPGKRR